MLTYVKGASKEEVDSWVKTQHGIKVATRGTVMEDVDGTPMVEVIIDEDIFQMKRGNIVYVDGIAIATWKTVRTNPVEIRAIIPKNP